MLSQVSLSRDVTLGSGRFYLMQLVSCMMHLFTPAYVYILSPSLPSLQAIQDFLPLLLLGLGTDDTDD